MTAAAAACPANCKRLRIDVDRGIHSRMVNLKEVAALAGDAAATVSRTLSAPHLVNAKTRERVERAIAELDYLPHGAARALRSNRTGSIGAVVPGSVKFSDGYDANTVKKSISLEAVTARAAGVSSAPS